MTPAKLNVFFSFYPYGSNGGTNQEHPNLREWFARTMMTCKNDPRVGEIFSKNFSDTPAYMNRNDAVIEARNAGADLLVMLDSDQHIDLYLGDHGVKPFWDSSFDFLYQRKMQKLISVIGAPYCGPPSNECVYVFSWKTRETNHPNPDISLDMVSREDAAVRSGIQAAAALPTGCIMFDMDIFEITDPVHEYRRLLESGVDRRTAVALTKPWFYYEWDTIYQNKKGSTEDVTATRDMSLLVQQKFGYSPIFCNWDAWAGHWKPKCVGKPHIIHADHVNTKFSEAVKRNSNTGERLIDVATYNRPDVMAEFLRQTRNGELVKG